MALMNAVIFMYVPVFSCIHVQGDLTVGKRANPKQAFKSEFSILFVGKYNILYCMSGDDEMRVIA